MEYLKIVCISDTHNSLGKILPHIPDGDILIHSGDATARGRPSDIIKFSKEMKSLPHKYKIFVPGNHDLLFEDDESFARALLDKEIICLIDQSVEIEGVKIYGSPWQPAFCDWAFNLRETELQEVWKQIPDDTEILITHGPPYSIGDRINNLNVGCKHLISEVRKREKLKLHIFGHIHNGYGHYKLNSLNFINASILNEQYEIANKPIVIDNIFRKPTCLI